MDGMSSPSGSRSPQAVVRPVPGDVLVLSAWCGLAAGELEVATRVLNRALGSTHRLFMMTRHFVWLVPLINLVLFLGLGVLLVLAMRRWPRRGVVGPTADRRRSHPAGLGACEPKDLRGSVVCWSRWGWRFA